MTSLAEKHEFHFRRYGDTERSSQSMLEEQEARDVDDASSEDIILHNPRGVALGIVLALGALGLGIAAGLGYVNAPALDPGPQPEPLTSRWQLDPQVARNFAKQATDAKTAPTATRAHAPAAEGPSASQADVTSTTTVAPTSAPSNSESGTTDNPY